MNPPMINCPGRIEMVARCVLYFHRPRSWLMTPTCSPFRSGSLVHTDLATIAKAAPCSRSPCHVRNWHGWWVKCSRWCPGREMCCRCSLGWRLMLLRRAPYLSELSCCQRFRNNTTSTDWSLQARSHANWPAWRNSTLEDAVHHRKL